MSSPANSINEQTTGICGFSGTAFVGSPATQHTVQIGGATTSALVSVANGTTGQFLGANTGAAPTWQTPAAEGTSYAFFLNTRTGNSNPADGVTYYADTIGNAWFLQTSLSTGTTIMIPINGTITNVAGRVNIAGTLGSDENVTIAIRVNDTTNNNVTTTFQMNANPSIFTVSGLSIAVSAGDFISLLFICPTWATNPTSCTGTCTIFIS